MPTRQTCQESSSHPSAAIPEQSILKKGNRHDPLKSGRFDSGRVTNFSHDRIDLSHGIPHAKWPLKYFVAGSVRYRKRCERL